MICNRNMPGEGVVLELAQHCPAQAISGRNTSSDTADGLELFFAEFPAPPRRGPGDQNLESLVAGEVDQATRA